MLRNQVAIKIVFMEQVMRDLSLVIVSNCVILGKTSIENINSKPRGIWFVLYGKRYIVADDTR